MKIISVIPLLFLTACSTAPKLAVRPASPPPENVSLLRYPEVIHAYHVGRYTNPNDDDLLHEQHVVYRVEENARWDLQPWRAATIGCPAVGATNSFAPRDAAFNPTPVNDAILAEVNSQRLATAQIIGQSQTLAASLAQVQNALQQARTNFQQTAALRVLIGDMKQRLAALEAARSISASTISTTNEPFDPLMP